MSDNSSLYRTLASQLMASIERGDFPVGTYLPTEQRLGEQYGVSRVTVRGALKELERFGLISRRARLGTRVESTHSHSEFVLEGDSLDSVLRFTKDLPFILLTFEVILPNICQVTEFQLSAGQRYAKVTGVRCKSGDTPALFSEHWIPALYAPEANKLNGLKGSLAEFLVHQRGDRIQRINQVIDVARLDRDQAVALKAPDFSPALRTRRWYRNQRADLVLMSTSVSPEGGYSIASVLQRNPR